MVNSSSKSHIHNYSNRQNKESTKSVLTASSDTPCDNLNGLHEQLLNHHKNVVIGYLNIFILSGIKFQAKILFLEKMIFVYYQKLK